MILNHLVDFIRESYQSPEFIPLHAPSFGDAERSFVLDTVDSTFVSSVGKYVDQFEQRIQEFTGASRAIATVNGTAALHAALYLSGVGRGDLVITQALTFVATCNAIHHLGAESIFCDVSKVSMGLCPTSVECFLQKNADLDGELCRLRSTGQVIRAMVPMHTFGHPVEIDELVAVATKWKIALIEDAAESLGSYYKGQHTGTFSRFSALSFNGNKIITTGGGGMILCKTEADGERTKHVTTTAKVPHAYEFVHDEPGFNYRMPNINAALGCGQMQSLEHYLAKKRELADCYARFFEATDYAFFAEPEYAQSNYWLNSIVCPDFESREELLRFTNEHGVMTRPIWQLMHRLPMFKDSIRTDLTNSEMFEARVVNLPSSPV